MAFLTPFCRHPFQAAIVGALVVAAAVWTAGYWASGADREWAAEKQILQMHQAAAPLWEAIRESREGEAWDALWAQVNRGNPEWQGRWKPSLAEEEGSGSNSEKVAWGSLAALESFGLGQAGVDARGQAWVQIDLPSSGQGEATFQIRRPLATPAWASRLPAWAAVAGLTSLLLFWLGLERRFRPKPSLCRAIQQAAQLDLRTAPTPASPPEFQDLASALDFTLQELRRSQGFLEEAYEHTAAALGLSIEAKDPLTHGHSRRVAASSVALGRLLALPDESLHDLRIGGLLHDVGKIGISEHVLQKPAALSAEETRLMEEHTLVGHRIVSAVPTLRGAAEIVRDHHERWDGAGYPAGKAGTEIPLLARVVAVADVFDALISPRAYKDSIPPMQAAQILQAQAGHQLDPHLVPLFLEQVANLPQLQALSESPPAVEAAVEIPAKLRPR
ncbi:MAG: HD-GYP domain-containing protein [Planctomycetota bacterium]|nr:MAG: HD-GYP domain-containing protein [Planctomycetota bacterium]